MADWLGADGDQQLKEALFRDERIYVVTLQAGCPGTELIGQKLRDVSLPGGTLVAMVRREDEVLIPRGDSVLEESDRVTVIGRPEGLDELRERYRPPKG